MSTASPFAKSRFATHANVIYNGANATVDHAFSPGSNVARPAALQNSPHSSSFHGALTLETAALGMRANAHNAHLYDVVTGEIGGKRTPKLRAGASVHKIVPVDANGTPTSRASSSNGTAKDESGYFTPTLHRMDRVKSGFDDLIGSAPPSRGFSAHLDAASPSALGIRIFSPVMKKYGTGNPNLAPRTPQHKVVHVKSAAGSPHSGVTQAADATPRALKFASSVTSFRRVPSKLAMSAAATAGAVSVSKFITSPVHKNVMGNSNTAPVDEEPASSSTTSSETARSNEDGGAATQTGGRSTKRGLGSGGTFKVTQNALKSLASQSSSRVRFGQHDGHYVDPDQVWQCFWSMQCCQVFTASMPLDHHRHPARSSACGGYGSSGVAQQGLPNAVFRSAYGHPCVCPHKPHSSFA